MTSVEEYRQMGEAHVKGDQEISRPEIPIQKRVNAHYIYGQLIWRSGQDHDNSNRIYRVKCQDQKMNQTARITKMFLAKLALLPQGMRADLLG